MIYNSASLLLAETLEEFKTYLEFKHQNIKTPPALYTKCHNEEISYNHNELGFRDGQLNRECDICYYGCSVTYGAGVAIQDRWTNVVDSHFKYISNNFAINGLSCEDILQIFISTSKFVNMKKAFVCLPDIRRSLIPLDENNKLIYHYLFGNFTEAFQKESKNYKYSKIFYTEIPDSVYYERTRVSIELIMNWARERNIELYVGTWSPDLYNFLISLDLKSLNIIRECFLLDGKGCDDMHPGKEAHYLFAKNAIEIINNNHELQSTV